MSCNTPAALGQASVPCLPPESANDPRCQEVQSVLDTLRSAMEADAGGVDLAGVSGDIVYVRLKGMCLHCPSSSLTLRYGIEATLRRRLQWVRAVIRVG